MYIYILKFSGLVSVRWIAHKRIYTVCIYLESRKQNQPAVGTNGNKHVEMRCSVLSVILYQRIKRKSQPVSTKCMELSAVIRSMQKLRVGRVNTSHLIE